MPEIICYCFGVEKRRVVEAIENGCRSVPEVRALLKVTGSCASCQPEIESLLDFYGRFPRRPGGSSPGVAKR
jgi:nitrite reductase (NADH) large subunit